MNAALPQNEKAPPPNICLANNTRHCEKPRSEVATETQQAPPLNTTLKHNQSTIDKPPPRPSPSTTKLQSALSRRLDHEPKDEGKASDEVTEKLSRVICEQPMPHLHAKLVQLRAPVDMNSAINKEEEAALKKLQILNDFDRFDHLLQTHPLKGLIGPPAEATLERGRAFLGKYEVLKPIGKGAFGHVFKARFSDPSKQAIKPEFAIKLLSKDCYATKDLMDELADEVNLLKHVHHKNVASAVEVVHETEYICIVMELATMNLSRYKKVYQMSLRSIRTVLKGVLEGLAFLHDNGIAHMDLKPANILILREVPPQYLTPDEIQICDLGVSIIGETITSVTGWDRRGTAALMAPEVFSSSPKEAYDAKSADMWSLGVILLDLVECRPSSWMDMFKQSSRTQYQGQLRQSLRKAQRKLRRCKRSLADLILQLLRVKPKNRLTVRQVQNHRWVSKRAMPPVQPRLKGVFRRLILRSEAPLKG